MVKRAFSVLMVLVSILVCIAASGCGPLPFPGFGGSGEDAPPEISEDDFGGELIGGQGPAVGDLSNYVYDAGYERNFAGESYKTPVGTYYARNLIVAYIALDSAEAQAANAELKQIFYDAVDHYNYEYDISVRDGYGVSHVLCDYTSSLNGRLLSVCQRFGVDANHDVVKYPDHYAFVFDVETASQLSYEQICGELGWNDAAAVRDNIVGQIESYLKELYGENVIESSQQHRIWYEKDLADSIREYDSDIRDGSLEFFLDAGGRLNVVVYVYTPHGRAQWEHIFMLEPLV